MFAANKVNHSPARAIDPGSPSTSHCYYECDALSLYKICSQSIISNLDQVPQHLNSLPMGVQIDLYDDLFMQQQWTRLEYYLSNLNNFINLVIFNQGRRQTLHMMVQRLMDEGLNFTPNLCEKMITEISVILKKTQSTNPLCQFDDNEDTLAQSVRLRTMKRAYCLAGFFMEAGWFVDAEKILTSSLTLHIPSIDEHNVQMEAWGFRVATRLLASLVSFSRFQRANEVCDQLLSLIQEKNYENSKEHFDVASAYNQFACLCAAQSCYKEAYKWSCQALTHLSPWTPKLSLIDILLCAGKSCVIRRDFESADYLLRQALLVSNELFNFGENCDFSEITNFHPIFGDLLSAIGYYYHNIDLHTPSVKLYLNALNFRKKYFGPYTPPEQCINLPLALAREDLAFEYYIQQYSTGHFDVCREQVEMAKMALETLLPGDHHLMTSVLRIKALILEEIAIDNVDLLSKTEMLMDAHSLHCEALRITRNLLGEENLQTAKHYANMGRLYQTMHRYEDSETSQLRSIEIKEKCLGKDDYEVGLSYGFLASLYCYDMEMYSQAESYYLKSIEIGSKLFGGAYSGLEIDYQGIIRVYAENGDLEKVEKYNKLLRSWRSQRDSLTQSIIKKDMFTCLADPRSEPSDLDSIKEHFFANRLHKI